jgi:geranylgeranyl pyrophosphate synthase
MIDDIIDYDNSGEKPFAHDLREGLVNFVTLEMLEANPTLREPIQKLLGHDHDHPVWPWKPHELVSACDRVRARAQAKLEAADQVLSQISKSISSLDFDALQSLRAILVYLRERIR